MSPPPTEPPEPPMAKATLPDQYPTFRHLDPAAALAFRTPLQEHPPAADTKAGAILTALGLMYTLLARFGDLHTEMVGAGGLIRFAVLVLLAGFGTCSLVAVVEAFRTISPRFPRSTPSLAFFGDIAAVGREDYVKAVEGLSHEEAVSQILIYNHTLARICVEKFRHLKLAVRGFLAGAGFWLVLMVVSVVRAAFR